MRRIGKTSDIMGQICDYGNISHSIDVVLSGKKRKRCRAGRYILAHRDEIIARLQKEISEGTFAITGYREMVVTDGPKQRVVQSVSLYERIGCNAIMHVVEKYLFPRYIRTTAASIKNRGIHDLKQQIERDIREDPKGTRFAYKYDYREFYKRIIQDLMMETLREIFKDKTLLTMLERFVRMMVSGLSIGLRSSQGFGNLFLSDIDHLLKDQYGLKYLYRYCDDGLALSDSKKKLWAIRNITHSKSAEKGLEIKPDERIFPTSQGIDMLGFVIYPTHTLLRKRNKKKAARRLHDIKSKKRRKQIMDSLYGQCKHASCHHLFKTLTGKNMSDYSEKKPLRRLKGTGIKAKYEDGKKRFDGAEINISELVGEEFLIKDFETDVVTRPQRKDYERAVAQQREELARYTDHGITPPEGFVYPEQVPKPIGKYLVSIVRNAGAANEREHKFFTGDGENKSILNQLREQGLIGETLCTVRPARCKGFTRYILS